MERSCTKRSSWSTVNHGSRRTPLRWPGASAGHRPGESSESADANAFNKRLLGKILDDGRVFLSSTTIAGVFWIRVAVLCFRSHRDRIEALLEVLERETRA